MTSSELAEATAAYGREMAIDAFQPMNRPSRDRWERARRKAGRPRRGRGAKVISVSVEQDCSKRPTGWQRSWAEPCASHRARPAGCDRRQRQLASEKKRPSTPSSRGDPGAAEIDREFLDSVEADQLFHERVLDRRRREGAEPARGRQETEGLGKVACFEPENAVRALDFVLPEGPLEDRRHHAEESRAAHPPLAGTGSLETRMPLWLGRTHSPIPEYRPSRASSKEAYSLGS